MQQAAVGKERCEKRRVLASGVRYEGIGSGPPVLTSPYRKLLWCVVTVQYEYLVAGGCLVGMIGGVGVGGLSAAGRH